MVVMRRRDFLRAPAVGIVGISTKAEATLRAVLLAVRPRVRPSDAVLVRFVLENHSPEPVTVVVAGFWANHRLLLFDKDGKPVTQTETGRLYDRLFKPGGERFKATTVTVGAGDSYEERPPINLRELFEIEVGHYSAQAIYEDRTPHWSGKLVSNRADITVSE